MSEIEFRGGPLNGYRVQSDAAVLKLEKSPDGRYELIDGIYCWHVGQPAGDETKPSTEATPTEADDEQDDEAPVEHVRPKRRPRTTTTRSKATPGGA